MILCTTCGKEIELKQQISSLKSQLAGIKYLNADEVEKEINRLIVMVANSIKFDSSKLCLDGEMYRPLAGTKWKVNNKEELIKECTQAICNLAIPEIKQKREDIIEILSRKHMDFLTREEIIKEQTNEIIKAIRGEE